MVSLLNDIEKLKSQQEDNAAPAGKEHARKDTRMKAIQRQVLVVAALVGASTLTSAQAQQLPTSGTVESRLGKLELKNGYPTDATAKKMYDDIDFQRACQAYLWALPIMSMVQWQGEQHKFGAGKRINLTKTLG